MKMRNRPRMSRKKPIEGSTLLSNDFGVTVAIVIVVEDGVAKYFVAKCDELLGITVSQLQLVYQREVNNPNDVYPVAVSGNQQFVVRRPDQRVEKVLVNADGEIVL